VQSASEFAIAREVAERILLDAAVERVAVGALLGAAGADWRVYTR
jgi:hypothetical protein